MNIKFSIRLQNDVLKDTDGNSIVFDKSESYYSTPMMLSPLYALPTDINDVFIEEPGIYESVLYKILFEGSMKIDTYLTSRVISCLGLSAEDAFYIKRSFTICYATYQFAKVFYRDYLKSIKKSKFLADVKISLEVEKDPDLITAVQNDAKKCMEEIIEALTARQSMQGFVKGSANPTSKFSAREWMPSLGNNCPDISIATSKAFFGGRIVKVGSQNRYIGNYGNFNSNSYYVLR